MKTAPTPASETPRLAATDDTQAAAADILPLPIVNPDRTDTATTDPASAELASAVNTPHAALPRLTITQQAAVLDLLRRGAGPVAVCERLGVGIDQFWETLQHDTGFSQAFQQNFDTLSLNVLASLYQTAIKGSTTAQQYFLRLRPPPHFLTADEEPSATSPLKHLSDDELVDECRAAGLDLPADIAARAAAKVGGD